MRVIGDGNGNDGDDGDNFRDDDDDDYDDHIVLFGEERPRGSDMTAASYI